MTKTQNILVAAATLGALLISSQAGAVSLGVKLACAADYHAHCSRQVSRGLANSYRFWIPMGSPSRGGSPTLRLFCVP